MLDILILLFFVGLGALWKLTGPSAARWTPPQGTYPHWR